MDSTDKKIKGPVTQDKIFRIMMIMIFAVSLLFFLKNIFSKSLQGAIVIGVCLLVFAFAVFLMKKMNVDQYKKQLVLSISLVLLVFLISANSGNFYSDDFPLFLAVVALCGIYLEPLYTTVQIIMITIAFVILYIINPGKADPLSQYIMCLVLFDVAAYIILIVIKRGRAFIEISQVRAQEAEELLASIKNVGEKLEANYQSSAGRVEGLQEANLQLETDANELRRGSDEITEGTKGVEAVCERVREKMQITGSQVSTLDVEVRNVEKALQKSREEMHTMDEQMLSVKEIIANTRDVFEQLQAQIENVSEVTEQLTGISDNTQLLALNASIEAARAGEAGKGFAVVASTVQELSVESNECSEQVVKVVSGMKQQIAMTSTQMEGSMEAINESIEKFAEMEKSFETLSSQFSSLYSNIEEQNSNVTEAEAIFRELIDKIGEMSTCSESNQVSVESIIEAISTYKEHIQLVMEDTKQIRQLSVNMLDASGN